MTKISKIHLADSDKDINVSNNLISIIDLILNEYNIKGSKIPSYIMDISSDKKIHNIFDRLYNKKNKVYSEVKPFCNMSNHMTSSILVFNNIKINSYFDLNEKGSLEYYLRMDRSYSGFSCNSHFPCYFIDESSLIIEFLHSINIETSSYSLDENLIGTSLSEISLILDHRKELSKIINKDNALFGNNLSFKFILSSKEFKQAYIQYPDVICNSCLNKYINKYFKKQNVPDLGFTENELNMIYLQKAGRKLEKQGLL